MTRILISIALFLLVVPEATSCQRRPSPTVSNSGSAANYAKLIDDLRTAGATVEPSGEVSQPFFTVKGKIIKVNGDDVQVFEYPNAAAAESATKDVAPDGSTVGKSRIGWIAPPHFYKKGKIIVLYVGKSASVTKVLESALGPQFAGK